jgi:hypothetical protein
MVTFVFTNPRHHLEMMVPVAAKLRDRDIAVRFVSLAELRGLRTPERLAGLHDVELVRVLPPWLRKSSSTGAGVGTSGGPAAFARNAARAVTWYGVLAPALHFYLRHSDVVVVPNDAAFPYDSLTSWLRKRGVPFVLLQEGIRFPLPTEQRASLPYGGNGAAMICAWGEASAEHFQKVAPSKAVVVTGTPRWDNVQPSSWREAGAALMSKLGLTRKPLLYLSNTVDDQGFCTTTQKMQLFADFIERAAPVLDGRAIVVKLHLRENVEAFRAVASKQSAAPVHVLGTEGLFETLAIGQAAVVLASTVGLEALAFDLPLGVLALPNHGHVFEYVSRGAAVGLELENLTVKLPQLLDAPHTPDTPVREFLERHLANRGNAASRIADRIAELRRSSS